MISDGVPCQRFTNLQNADADADVNADADAEMPMPRFPNGP